VLSALLALRDVPLRAEDEEFEFVSGDDDDKEEEPPSTPSSSSESACPFS
jgi:hypothetical protein